jgi:hypothetical protein
LVRRRGLRLGVPQELELLVELDLLRLRLSERGLRCCLRGLCHDEGLLGGDAKLLAFGAGHLCLIGQRASGVLLLVRTVVDA